jgi:hypothetical protein
MIDISNYWNLSTDEQQAILTAHPVTPLRDWRVVGRLNIQYQRDMTAIAYGFDIDTTINTYSAQAATRQVANGVAGLYQNVTSVEWLKGPTVMPVEEWAAHIARPQPEKG